MLTKPPPTLVEVGFYNADVHVSVRLSVAIVPSPKPLLPFLLSNFALILSLSSEVMSSGCLRSFNTNSNPVCFPPFSNRWL